MALSSKRIVPFLVVLGVVGPGCGSSPSNSAACDSTGPTPACLIAEVCYPAGTASPGNPCLVCDPARDGAGWSDDDGQACDDGLACTSADSCSAGACHGQAACLANEACDAVSGECVATCDGCVIGGVCYGAGQPSPQNGCVQCDPAASTVAWSDADGAPCDDGVFCNGADTCSGGTCATHAGDPCGDDGVYCNGTESCNEPALRCDHSGDPCTGGDLCLEATAQCCVPNVPAAAPVCDANGDAVATDSCGNDFVYEDCPDAHGTCVDGRCGCQPHFVGQLCDRCVDGWFGAECDQRCAVRVDGATGNDSHDGSTWGTAVRTIPMGLELGMRFGCEVWVAAGTYTPGTVATATFRLVSGVELYGGFAGTESMRAERDVAAHPTILSGDLGAGVRATHVVTGADGAVIDGFTIRDGLAAGTFVPGNPAVVGAGMLNSDVSPTIANCTFTANAAAAGAGMANIGAAAPLVTGCTFTGNSATGGGGGMYNGDQSAPRVFDSTFTSNLALDGTQGAGGAMLNYTGGMPEVGGCTFSGNTAGMGGALVNADTAGLLVTGSTFVGNSAPLGGAMLTMVQSAASSTVLVDRCTFRANAAAGSGGLGAQLGGALVVAGGANTVTNSVFVANASGNMGGAITVYQLGSVAATLTLTNATIASNQAAGGGGGLLIGGAAAVATVTNSILWGNAAPSMPQIGVASGTLTVTASDVQGGYAGTGNLDQDPLFVGAPGDLHLGSTSPCIDVGSNAAAGATDADGKARVVDGESNGTATVDMGAYEYRCTAEGATCAAIKVATPTAASGVYYINPGGGCGFPAWCDMTTDGGGWTVVNAITGANGEEPLVSDVAMYGTPLAFGHHNLRRSQKAALAALSTESILVRQSGAWLKLDRPLFDQGLTTPNTHVDVPVGLTARNGTTASGYMGYSNFNITGGGDFYVGQTAADHHLDLYYHLNAGCAGQYLYSYSSVALDGDAGYDVNATLGDWTATSGCNSDEGGALRFFSAMR